MHLTKRKRTLVAIWSSALSCAGVLDPHRGGGGGGHPDANPQPSSPESSTPGGDAHSGGHRRVVPERPRWSAGQRRHRAGRSGGTTASSASSSSSFPALVASPWLEFQTPSVRDALSAIRLPGGNTPSRSPPPDNPEEAEDRGLSSWFLGEPSNVSDPWHDDVDGPPSLLHIVPEGGDDEYDYDGAAVAEGALPTPSRPLHSPLVYRFYGKSRSRTPAAGSVPFVLLGPNVDHFKVTGHELAAKGFSVLACERVPEGAAADAAAAPPDGTPESPPPEGQEHGALLVRELLDALRWSRVVLVGCDSEALLTVRAALKLAPERVAGLVLCGDLDAVDAFVATAAATSEVQSGAAAPSPSAARRTLASHFSVDLFLRDRLQCPFAVVWAGDDSPTPFGHSASSAAELATLESLAANRLLILGGGAAPHRRRPELFAWVLTRFVEERIAPASAAKSSEAAQRARGGQQRNPVPPLPPSPPPPPEPRPLNRLVRLRELLWSPGSFVVTGRMVATTILYWAVLKVAIHQFDNVCYGMVNVQSAVKSVQSVRQVAWRWAVAVLAKLGSLFVLTSDRPPDPPRQDHAAATTASPDVAGAGYDETAAAGLDEADDGGDRACFLDEEGGSTLPPRSNTSDPTDPPRVPPPKDEEPAPPMPKPLFFLDNVVA